MLRRYVRRFDGAYDSDSQQEDLFHNEIEPTLESVFKGIHTTIFAYGITGAGAPLVSFSPWDRRAMRACGGRGRKCATLTRRRMVLQARRSPCRERTNSPASSRAWPARS